MAIENGNEKGINTLTVPSTWCAAVGAFSNLLASKPSAKLLLCGAKGVGKSSCLRYTINRLLKKCKVICLLDCDVGQPECGLPGTTSLYLIKEPLLAPPHLNARTPILSFYLGDISTKNDPNLLIEMVVHLLGRYDEVREGFAKGMGSQWVSDLSRHHDSKGESQAKKN